MKSIKLTIIFLLVILASYFFLMFCPQVMFSNKFKYKIFTVYYHSGEISQQDLISIIDKSVELMEKSELFDNGINQKIYLCSGFYEYTFFVPLSRKGFGANYPISHDVFISKPNTSANTAEKNEIENNVRTLSSVISHESMHSLISEKLGFLKYKFLPSWKNEGYCEYIANESSYDEKRGLAEICEGKNNTASTSFEYFKYRLYTKYLFDDERINIDKFFNVDFDFIDLNKKIFIKYCSGQ